MLAVLNHHFIEQLGIGLVLRFYAGENFIDCGFDGNHQLLFPMTKLLLMGHTGQERLLGFDGSILFFPLRKVLLFGNLPREVQIQQLLFFRLAARNQPLGGLGVNARHILLDDQLNHLQEIVCNLTFVKPKLSHNQAHDMDCILIANARAGTAHLVSGSVNMGPSVLAGLVAAPPLIAAPILSGFISGDIAGTAASAFDFPRKGITV